jgi:hypothetical protein
VLGLGFKVQRDALWFMTTQKENVGVVDWFAFALKSGGNGVHRPRQGDGECQFFMRYSGSCWITFSADQYRSLPLISLRPRNREHKCRQFVGVQLSIMIPISAGKLHFQEPKHLVFRDRLGRCNRSHVILDCHENLRPQKGPFKTWANHAIAVSWTAIIAPRRIKLQERRTESSMGLIVPAYGLLRA